MARRGLPDRLVLEFAELEIDLLLFAVAYEREVNGLVRTDPGDLARKIAAVLNACLAERVITSPDLRPAFAAGLPACASATSAPVALSRPRLSAMSAVKVWTCTPSQPRSTCPLVLSCWTTP